MNVCVFGMWHLGCVTAACLAKLGHSVVGLDPDVKVIAGLCQGNPPLFEPGLKELLKDSVAKKSLSFTSDASKALSLAEVLWVTFDTPVDEDDRADVDFVFQKIADVLPLLKNGAAVVLSSQLPVGTGARIQDLLGEIAPGKTIHVCCSPENLRLGKALQVFMEPDRIIVGIPNAEARCVIEPLFTSISPRVEWMSVASAEMTKHAINSFLAASVTFINEIATLCEYTGADAKEVERGLKSEMRIGPKAYLSPGGAFAGGTLARDIEFLGALAEKANFPAHVLRSIRESNLEHKRWAHRRLTTLLGGVKGKSIAVWGLTYKPGTDTLRRSSAIELCKLLADEGAVISAFDPAVKTLPQELSEIISLESTAMAAAQGADALVVATEWPEFREINAQPVISQMRESVIIDANRFLQASFGELQGVAYNTVGRSNV